MHNIYLFCFYSFRIFNSEHSGLRAVPDFYEYTRCLDPSSFRDRSYPLKLHLESDKQAYFGRMCIGILLSYFVY